MGRLMVSLTSRLKNSNYTFVFRRNRVSLSKLKAKKKYLKLFLEILTRILDHYIFSIRLFFIKDSKVLLIHPQTIGFNLFFRLKNHNKIFYYVMDNSFFCVRSYNVHPLQNKECLQCLDVLKPLAECKPSPVSMSLNQNLKNLKRLKNESMSILFLSQNKNQKSLLKLHFGDSVKVRIIGMDTNEVHKKTTLNIKEFPSYDIVFHGSSLIAKGILYFIELAINLPNYTFFIPDSKENLAKIFNSFLPNNVTCECVTWESGLLEIVQQAKLVVNPSLWSAPIEGALIKSSFFNDNVATVETKYGFENEVTFIKNHIRLSEDISEAKNQVESFLVNHWNDKEV